MFVDLHKHYYKLTKVLTVMLQALYVLSEEAGPAAVGPPDLRVPPHRKVRPLFPNNV